MCNNIILVTTTLVLDTPSKIDSNHLGPFLKMVPGAFQIWNVDPLEHIFKKSESGIKLATCCFATASPALHSLSSFFHSLSNFPFSADKTSLQSFSGMGLIGSLPVPSMCSMMPLASSVQMKCSLNMTQFDPDMSSLGIRRNLLPSLVLMDIVRDLGIDRDCQKMDR